MEEHLARTTEKLCEHMFNICELIKGVQQSNAMEGLELIAAVRGLFLMSFLAVGSDCPVQELLNVQQY